MNKPHGGLERCRSATCRPVMREWRVSGGVEMAWRAVGQQHTPSDVGTDGLRWLGAL